jgi:maltose alpha-D-glucosyltransferase/alpha-amylase
MPRIFMALRRGEVSPLVWILNRTPAIPESCQWCTFLRNHDELTLEMVTEEERQWMWEQYAPDPRMRLNLGIRRRLAPLLDNDRRKIELANSLLFTMPGSPVVYYGDEIGMGDNIHLFDRNGVRTPMQWNAGLNAGFSEANPLQMYSPVIDDPIYGPEQVNVASQREDLGSLLNVIRKMIRVRKLYPAFGRGDFNWVDGAPASVAAYLRSYLGRHLLILNNLSPQPQSATLQIPTISTSQTIDLLDEGPSPELNDGLLEITLEPYQYRWLQL